MKNNTILLLLITSIFAVSCSEKREIVHVRDIVLNCNEQYLLEGEYFQLKATIQPFDADNCKIFWSSSDLSVMRPCNSVTYGLAEGNSLIAKCSIRGNTEGDALLTAKSDDGGIIAACNVHVRRPFTLVEGQACVDLGLSVRWAYRNLGANTPTEYGDFFAWGEIEPKSYFNKDTYKFYRETGRASGYTKYCTENREALYTDGDIIDGKIVLELSDDAVRRQYGGSWRMPTVAEWEELYNCCTWTLTTVNSVYGCLVRGKNGNQIFLPAAGFMYQNKHYDGVTYYWSSSLDINDSSTNGLASTLVFGHSYHTIKNMGREDGCCIRGVIR